MINIDRVPLCLTWSPGRKYSNQVFYYDIALKKYSWATNKRMNFLRFSTVQVGKDVYRYRQSSDGMPAYIKKYKDLVSK